MTINLSRRFVLSVAFIGLVAVVAATWLTKRPRPSELHMAAITCERSQMSYVLNNLALHPLPETEAFANNMGVLTEILLPWFRTYGKGCDLTLFAGKELLAHRYSQRGGFKFGNKHWRAFYSSVSYKASARVVLFFERSCWYAAQTIRERLYCAVEMTH